MNQKLLRQCLITAVCGALIIALSACTRPATSPDTSLLARLERGVNLSHWWTAPADNPAFPKITTPNAADLNQLRATGLTHVRLPVTLQRLANARGHLKPASLAHLLADVRRLTEADLGVIVAVQTSDQLKHNILTNDAAFQQFSDDWGILARTLSALPATHLVLELLNEPATEDASLWARRQLDLARVVRKAAPQHTLMLAGAHYSDIEDLVITRPIPDGNVVYSFHFYTPHNFTHQGADWGWPMWQRLRGLPYPSSPDLVAPIIDSLPYSARPHAKQYGEEQWNRIALSRDINTVAAWAKRHSVIIHCSEFGAILSAPADSRARWLRDVRTELEASNIGWSVWDYAGQFAIADGARGQRTLTLP